jgi:hypothetical protein
MNIFPTERPSIDEWECVRQKEISEIGINAMISERLRNPLCEEMPVCKIIKGARNST